MIAGEIVLLILLIVTNAVWIGFTIYVIEDSYRYMCKINDIWYEKYLELLNLEASNANNQTII